MALIDLRSLSRGSHYNLLKHNCNNFSEALCQFLCGVSIPKYILDLPSEFLSTPLGQSIAPLIASLDTPREGGTTFSFEPQVAQRAASPGFDELNSEIEQARQESIALEERRRNIKEKVSKKGKKEKKDKSKKKSKQTSPDSENSNSMSEAESSGNLNGSNGESVPAEMLPSERAIEDEAEERRKEEERKRLREPPIVYKDIDVSI